MTNKFKKRKTKVGSPNASFNLEDLEDARFRYSSSPKNRVEASNNKELTSIQEVSNPSYEQTFMNRKSSEMASYTKLIDPKLKVKAEDVHMSKNITF
jgi:hypothetical protein